MTLRDIGAVIEAYGEAADAAHAVGFDGVEIHAAHGYLIDQFFWAATNRRQDAYGGDAQRRARFALEVIGEIRRRVPADFPVSLRFSQSKIQDYSAKLVQTPDELADFLRPLSEAGVDLFHCSQRRFWEAEFAGSPLNLAGWTRLLTGKPTISVGSVSLNQEFTRSFDTADPATATDIDALLERMAQDEFDLIAIGRALLSNADWPALARRGALAELRPFQRDALQRLE